MAFNANMGIEAHALPEITEIQDFIWSGCGGWSQDYSIPDELLCLVAWVVGDGNIKKDKRTSSKIVRFGFTKERKIKRVCMLCDALGYTYNIRKTDKQTSIEADLLSPWET